MLKKLINPLAQVVLWLLHRVMFAATYGIIYLETYLDDDLAGRDTAEVKNLYIKDLTHFKDQREIILTDKAVQKVYSALQRLSLWSSKEERAELAIEMVQVFAVIPQIRTNKTDGKCYYAFVERADIPDNICISMWMAYFYMHKHGSLSDD